MVGVAMHTNYEQTFNCWFFFVRRKTNARLLTVK